MARHRSAHTNGRRSPDHCDFTCHFVWLRPFDSVHKNGINLLCVWHCLWLSLLFNFGIRRRCFVIFFLLQFFFSLLKRSLLPMQIPCKIMRRTEQIALYIFCSDLAIIQYVREFDRDSICWNKILCCAFIPQFFCTFFFHAEYQTVIIFLYCGNKKKHLMWPFSTFVSVIFSRSRKLREKERSVAVKWL